MEIAIPQPSVCANRKAKLAASLVADALTMFGVPGGAVASQALQSYLQRKLEEAREILFEAVAEGNVELLSDPDYENLIPNTLSYFESARRGEYRHNLIVLAKLLAGEIASKQSDPGKISRAARRLEAMSDGDLRLLAVLHALFEEKERSKDFDGLKIVRLRAI